MTQYSTFAKVPFGGFFEFVPGAGGPWMRIDKTRYAPYAPDLSGENNIIHGYTPNNLGNFTISMFPPSSVHTSVGTAKVVFLKPSQVFGEADKRDW